MSRATMSNARLLAFAALVCATACTSSAVEDADDDGTPIPVVRGQPAPSAEPEPSDESDYSDEPAPTASDEVTLIDGGRLHAGISFIRAPDPGLRVYVREGSWSDLDAMLAATPLDDTAVVQAIDLASAPRDDNIGLEFRGHLAVPKSGVYTFRLDATTAARLTITQRRIVDGSGAGAIGLAAGYHPFHLAWMHTEGSAAQLNLTWDGPAGTGALPAKVLVQ